MRSFVAISLCQLKWRERTQRKAKKNHRAILASLCVLCGHFPLATEMAAKEHKEKQRKIIEPSLPLYAFFVAISLWQLKWPRKDTKKRKEKKNHRAILASLCVLCGHFPLPTGMAAKETQRKAKKNHRAILASLCVLCWPFPSAN